MGQRSPPQGSLPSVRSLRDERFIATLSDPRTRIDFVQGGRVQAHPGWAVQRRAIAEHLIYLIVEHTLEGNVAGRSMTLEPGNFVWVMPGVPHEFTMPRGWPRFSFYHFKIGTYGSPRGSALRPSRRCVVLQNAQALQNECALLTQEAFAASRFKDSRVRAALTLLMSTALAMDHAAGTAGRAFTQAQQLTLSDYVAKNLSKRPASSDLAALLRLNRDYFTRQFRGTYGLSPRAWLVRERMNAAARRLADSTLTISEVAYELGFADVFLFSRQFKRVFGRSPRAYRQNAFKTHVPV